VTEAPPPAALPAGSKDVLAVEARELRAIEGAVRACFERFGYREVMTPVLEFAGVIDRAQEGGLRRAVRLFDEGGRVLVLRPDLTIPIARLVATRMADHPGPVRVSYLARAFRPPAPGRAEPAEQRQAGVELVGASGPGADAEALALLVQSLRAAGLGELRVGVGDVSLTAAVLDGLAIAPGSRDALGAALAARSFVDWRRLARAAMPEGPGSALLAELPSLRGGGELLERIATEVPAARGACGRLEETLGLLERHGAREQVIVDLGVLRDWPYYSGVVFEAYAPGVGSPVAVGGRYDGLAGRFGRPRPAVGFGIQLDLLHRALMASGEPPAPPADGVVLVGGLDRELQAASAARAAGVAVVAVAEDEPDPDGLAAADGWRWAARRDGEGYALHDRATGARVTCRRLEEALTSPS
jgi:ATP phosphoribosyltransferase regulatory subunit